MKTIADPETPADFNLSRDQLAYIVLTARGYGALVAPTDPDEGSNASDDRAIDVLEDTPDNPIGKELRAAIATLNVEAEAEQAATADALSVGVSIVGGGSGAKSTSRVDGDVQASAGAEPGSASSTRTTLTLTNDLTIAATSTDSSVAKLNAGAGGILVASMIFFSVLESRPVLHEILIFVFVTVTTPVTLMLLARAALFRDRTEGDTAVPSRDVMRNGGAAAGGERQQPPSGMSAP